FDLAISFAQPVQRFDASSCDRPHLGRIDHAGLCVLGEQMLAAQHGGHLPARERNGQLIPQQALYRVVLEALPSVGAAYPQHVLRGRVVVDGQRKSFLADYLRTAVTVVVREAAW
ncbi:MAG: hypothetical protein ABI885_25025, partial [Gammaproteobacteria bacterium]